MLIPETLEIDRMPERSAEGAGWILGSQWLLESVTSLFVGRAGDPTFFVSHRKLPCNPVEAYFRRS